ncbi:LPXTG cell wall anchor domain-containing protein [Streptomyces sp. NPDC051940]|uniref:LPXTG cell wall anchor domain-containing protein n=1 Tax=Streptomyces sp. NPDC051940 TaxID=3155675 RepID=UPI003422826A
MRRAAGAAAALVAAGALLAGGGAGVAGAEETVRFQISTGFDRTVPVRADGHGDDYRPLSFTFYNNGLSTLRNVEVVVDGSALKGVGELDLPKGCGYASADKLRVQCFLGDVKYGMGGLDIGVRAAAGAPAGASGKVAFAMDADNGTLAAGSGSAEVGVTVGDGADLAINDLGQEMKVAPGTQTPVRLEVTNLGTKDAAGVEVFIRGGLGNVAVLGNHSNCVYESYDGAQRGAFCTFPDTVVKPGQTYVLDEPVTLSVPEGGHGDVLQYGDAVIGSDWVGDPEGEPGTGAPLALVPDVEAPNTLDAEQPLDIDEYNNLNSTVLTTGNVTDIAAVGGTVNTRVGAETNAVFRVRNSGTTTLPATNADGGPGIRIWAVFPANVEVVSAPKGCTKEHAGPENLAAYPLDTDHPETNWTYGCSKKAALEPGAEVKFTFRVALQLDVDDSYAGVVAAAEAEDFTASRINNAARLYFKATDDGTGPDGDLAETGGSGGTTWLVAGGSLTVALGAGLLLTARRRKAAGA